MATISLPTEAKITYHSPRLVFPGQVELESLYGVGDQVINRAPGHWVGTFDIAQVNTGSPEEKKIRSFVAALRGISNTMEIPVKDPSLGGIPTGTAITIMGSPSIIGGKLFVATNYAHATKLLQEGDQVRIGRRMYILDSNMAPAGALSLNPAVVPESGEINLVWEDVPVHARVFGRIDEWRRTPEFSGPWSIPYREVPK